MAAGFYENILEELGKILEIPDLTPDENNTCLIHFPDGLEIYLEMDKSRQNIVVGANLGEIPPGRYRADFFRQALKANGLPPPRFGTFAYSKQANSFVAYELLPRATVTAEAIAEFLLPFMEKARKWKEGLERGEIPSLESSQSPSPSGSGMFGLR